MKQSRAIELMNNGKNIFLTGPPGSGKTYVLNKFIQSKIRNGTKIAITASTGIAATHINGQTIHSWSGLNGKYISDNQKKSIKNAEILIIDEISMLSDLDFEKIDLKIRSASGINKPFGGKQVILVGDFFQLPPVSKIGEIKYIFESKLFDELALTICYLNEQHRQNAEDPLINILMAIRTRNVNLQILRSLNKKVIHYYPNNFIKLYSHNYDVNRLNLLKNDNLESKWFKYEKSFLGENRLIENFSNDLSTPDQITLKIGSKVMFTVNNPEHGYFNGTVGVVVDFKYYKPVVRTEDGKYIFVDWYEFKFSDAKLIAKQIPLKLSWALSIHKSQGMSLDKAEIDLTNSFTPGMGYVALSRLKSMNGLVLKGFNNLSLQVSDKAYEFDKELRRRSE